MLATALSGVFWAGVLLREGFGPPFVFLILAAMLAMRFALRPLVLVIAPALGARYTLMLGSVVSAIQFPLLGYVHGVDGLLAAFIVTGALGEVLYWTTFHTCFALSGEESRLGRQTSLRQVVTILVSIVGPPVGGLLMMHSPMLAFLLSAGLRVLAALPLMALPPLPIARETPGNMWREARFGVAIFATEGWTVMSAGTAWALIAFIGLGERYDALGAAMALAALAGAGATWLLGRHIDLGHGWRAVRINLAAGLLLLALQASAGYAPLRIVAAMLVAAAVGGLSTPAIMTAVYARAKVARCPLRFQFAAEGGFDFGGTLSCLLAAAGVALGMPLHAIILFGVPGLAIQAWLMRGVYGSPASPVAGLPSPASPGL